MKLVELANNEVLKQVSNLYKEIWNSEDNSIRERILKHSSYKGFNGLVVLSDDGIVVGFSYGYTSLPGQFYHELLAKELSSEEYQNWLQDCFEFVELAVHPLFRKQGIGKMLTEKLLEDVNNKVSVLTTQVDNISARSLYESLHWKVIKEPFYPGDSKNPYVIMGRKL